ncbi:MAG TPA: hydrogenase subunit MbhD domain-containing protein [Salinisphaeraceae bacterium]|nr:hydrogenase subunit MbhD domain-containing protein [Salinisphaeraceae bacterium]
MTALMIVTFILVAGGAAAVVFTREPLRQAVTLSAYGLVLSLLFVVLQAPDVALSQLAVGTAVVPLIVVLAIAKTRARKRQ